MVLWVAEGTAHCRKCTSNIIACVKDWEHQAVLVSPCMWCFLWQHLAKIYTSLFLIDIVVGGGVDDPCVKLLGQLITELCVVGLSPTHLCHVSYSASLPIQTAWPVWPTSVWFSFSHTGDNPAPFFQASSQCYGCGLAVISFILTLDRHDIGALWRTLPHTSTHFT